VRGQQLTPFVLSFLHRWSDGRTLRANKDLVLANAQLAGEIAAALA
jgi:pseudouridine-5'-phosphate glycosidase